eukprot:c2634_g1_i2.p1 GENE.c2634_g1_i2~~c2634_g1_i2.p1  ORF type:complete len:1478 (-),score=383.92 c2634_g1_i2:212-4645(-)
MDILRDPRKSRGMSKLVATLVCQLLEFGKAGVISFCESTQRDPQDPSPSNIHSLFNIVEHGEAFDIVLRIFETLCSNPYGAHELETEATKELEAHKDRSFETRLIDVFANAIGNDRKQVALRMLASYITCIMGGFSEELRYAELMAIMQELARVQATVEGLRSIGRCGGLERMLKWNCERLSEGLPLVEIAAEECECFDLLAVNASWSNKRLEGIRAERDMVQLLAEERRYFRMIGDRLKQLGPMQKNKIFEVEGQHQELVSKFKQASNSSLVTLFEKGLEVLRLQDELRVLLRSIAEAGWTGMVTAQATKTTADLQQCKAKLAEKWKAFRAAPRFSDPPELTPDPRSSRRQMLGQRRSRLSDMTPEVISKMLARKNQVLSLLEREKTLLHLMQGESEILDVLANENRGEVEKTLKRRELLDVMLKQHPILNSILQDREMDVIRNSHLLLHVILQKRDDAHSLQENAFAVSTSALREYEMKVQKAGATLRTRMEKKQMLQRTITETAFARLINEIEGRIDAAPLQGLAVIEALMVAPTARQNILLLYRNRNKDKFMAFLHCIQKAVRVVPSKLQNPWTGDGALVVEKAINILFALCSHNVLPVFSRVTLSDLMSDVCKQMLHTHGTQPRDPTVPALFYCERIKGDILLVYIVPVEDYIVQPHSDERVLADCSIKAIFHQIGLHDRNFDQLSSGVLLSVTAQSDTTWTLRWEQGLPFLHHKLAHRLQFAKKQESIYDVGSSLNRVFTSNEEYCSGAFSFIPFPGDESIGDIEPLIVKLLRATVDPRSALTLQQQGVKSKVLQLIQIMFEARLWNTENQLFKPPHVAGLDDTRMTPEKRVPQNAKDEAKYLKSQSKAKKEMIKVLIEHFNAGECSILTHHILNLLLESNVELTINTLTDENVLYHKHIVQNMHPVGKDRKVKETIDCMIQPFMVSFEFATTAQLDRQDLFVKKLIEEIIGKFSWWKKVTDVVATVKTKVTGKHRRARTKHESIKQQMLFRLLSRFCTRCVNLALSRPVAFPRRPASPDGALRHTQPRVEYSHMEFLWDRLLDLDDESRKEALRAFTAWLSFARHTMNASDITNGPPSEYNFHQIKSSGLLLEMMRTALKLYPQEFTQTRHDTYIELLTALFRFDNSTRRDFVRAGGLNTLCSILYSELAQVKHFHENGLPDIVQDIDHPDDYMAAPQWKIIAVLRVAWAFLKGADSSDKLLFGVSNLSSLVGLVCRVVQVEFEAKKENGDIEPNMLTINSQRTTAEPICMPLEWVMVELDSSTVANLTEKLKSSIKGNPGLCANLASQQSVVVVMPSAPPPIQDPTPPQTSECDPLVHVTLPSLPPCIDKHHEIHVRWEAKAVADRLIVSVPGTRLYTPPTVITHSTEVRLKLTTTQAPVSFSVTVLVLPEKQTEASGLPRLSNVPKLPSTPQPLNSSFLFLQPTHLLCEDILRFMGKEQDCELIPARQPTPSRRIVRDEWRALVDSSV